MCMHRIEKLDPKKKRPKYGWKVMQRDSSGIYHSEFYRHATWPLNKWIEARGWVNVREIGVDGPSLHGGVFHIYKTRDDARRASDSGNSVVKVEMKDVLYTGFGADGSPQWGARKARRVGR